MSRDVITKDIRDVCRLHVDTSHQCIYVIFHQKRKEIVIKLTYDGARKLSRSLNQAYQQGISRFLQKVGDHRGTI